MKLPPFGKRVKSILQDPSQLQRYSGCNQQFGTVWIATGPDAWEWQKAHPKHLTLVLPDGENPCNFCWSFLQGHEPILITGEASQHPAQRRQIAAALFRDGIERALAGRILVVADNQARAA